MLAYASMGEGPAVVLLHAFPLDRSLYSDVVGPVADAGWQVITPDLPGFGASPDIVPSIDDMASRVAELLDHLGVHSAVVGGCSMGGYVAMAFASQYPNRTAGLVLIDTKGNADGDEARANRERIASQVETSGSTDALAVTQVDAMFSAHTKAHRPDVVAWLQRTIRAQAPAGVSAAQRAMADRAEQFEMLARLRVPVLCVRGTEDALSSAADHTRMAEAAVDGLDVTVADAGHLVPIEQPEAFCSRLLPFLAQVRGPHC